MFYQGKYLCLAALIFLLNIFLSPSIVIFNHLVDVRFSVHYRGSHDVWFILIGILIIGTVINASVRV